MKKIIIGFIAGVIFATAGTAMAQTAIEKITAYVRTDFSVELDGQKVELKNAPLAYNGSSYLPVREVSEMLGKEVDFEDGVIKLDTPIADPAAEFERRKKDLENAQHSLNVVLKQKADMENGTRNFTEDQKRIMFENIETFQTSLNFYQQRLNDFLEQYPEYAE